jgi:hypothetical protein
MPFVTEAMRLLILESNQLSMAQISSLSSIIDSSATVRMMRSTLAT